MRTASLFLLALLTLPAAAQQAHTHAPSRVMVFPDVPGYHTLICDFHIHTVFSDGAVWPSIRVQEALRDGLDAISLTEHLEYQPYSDDIPHPDRNRSYAVALEAAGDRDLIVVNGSEITRDMPPGHTNAIFITDANRLLQDDSMAVFQEANAQGAFTFWNHPNWTAQVPDGVARLTDLHRTLIDEGLLHGIEVVNEMTYSDEALQIALDHDLTIMGTSDIHGLVDWQFKVPQGGHRPVTLVFATERSAAGIQDGLVNRRTVVWHNDLLVGRPEHLQPLLEAALVVETARYQDDTSVAVVTLENRSSTPFYLEKQSDFTLHRHADLVFIAPHATQVLEVKTLSRLEAFDLSFEVLNALTAPDTHPTLTFRIRP